MSRLLRFAVFAALPLHQGCAASRAPANATAGQDTIFREISVDPLPPIRLGAPFAAQSASRRLNDSTYQLQPDGFGGTRQLLIHLDADGTVSGISFVYGDEETYEAKVADYVASLGAPVAAGVQGDSIWTRWQDHSTRFEVSRVRRGGAETQRSRLWNLRP